MATTSPRLEERLVPAERLRRPIEARAQARAVDARALARDLARTVDGDVRFDEASRGLYAQDGSNYWQTPLGVVLPRSVEGAIATVAACRAHGVAVLPRGGGTALAGQTTTRGVVIDFTKHMNRILELNALERYAVVEPGVVCDTLVHAARAHGLTWGPQPATHDRCAFGGMIGNNCGGMHAQMNGIAVHNVEAIDALLYDGTRLTAGWMTEDEMRARIARGGREGELLAQLDALRRRYEPEVRARYPKIPRRVSGYNLDQLIPGDDGRFNLARVLVGSEGTLVTYLGLKLHLIDARAERVLVVLGFDTIDEAADRVPEILPFQPTALEGIDDRLHRHILQKGGEHAKHLKDMPEGRCWLVVEIGTDDKEETRRIARELVTKLRHATSRYEIVEDPRRMKAIADVREAGLGVTAFVKGEADTWEGWEDSAVAPERLGEYLRALRALLDRYGYDTALYGHFGQGCVHARIDFDLASALGIAKWRRFLDEAADLVVSMGGSISGEHGDGQSKAELLVKMFGPDLIRAFRELKAIWDPDGKMNPGKIVDPFPIASNLRLGVDYEPWEPSTHFAYAEDGGSFAHATLRCVGIGKCRREGAGEAGHDTMCPSYMVTRDEMHSTRGRAHLLWEMVRGGESPVRGGWRDEGVKEALDLCLSCKGCKGDCPVNVDMATYKAEFLAHYYEGRVRPRSAYAFGFVDRVARLASLVPGLANLVTQAPGLRAIAKLAAGIDSSRRLPAFAPESFQAWLARREAPRREATRGEVVLWPDTFNNYFFPDTLRAALEVLEAAGFVVTVPRRHVCCGRPLYDFGMLDHAKRYLHDVLAELRPHVERGAPMVVLEPSCASVFQDELTSLLPHSNEARNLRASTFTLSAFLAKHAPDFEVPPLHRKAIAQGHCHHKAVLGFDDEEAIAKKAGLDFELLASGCCGMAGSFGFESGVKKDVAQACGERALLPRVRDEAPSTIVLADGFSCREMIAQSTDRHGLHLAHVLQAALRGDRALPAEYPERDIVRARERAARRSMRRAAAGLVLAGLAVAAVASLRGRA
jgi:FAD/FMN-containing dehydrogenase/Fe-S oxidoreductase